MYAISLVYPVCDLSLSSSHFLSLSQRYHTQSRQLSEVEALKKTLEVVCVHFV